jgi:hypothetical protein
LVNGLGSLPLATCSAINSLALGLCCISCEHTTIAALGMPLTRTFRQKTRVCRYIVALERLCNLSVAGDDPTSTYRRKGLTISKGKKNQPSHVFLVATTLISCTIRYNLQTTTKSFDAVAYYNFLLPVSFCWILTLRSFRLWGGLRSFTDFCNDAICISPLPTAS